MSGAEGVTARPMHIAMQQLLAGALSWSPDGGIVQWPDSIVCM